MNDTPTSGPMAKSNTHHALDTRSSRHSLSTSQRNADLGERKEHLFQALIVSRRVMPGCQHREFRNRAFAAQPPAPEQREAVAGARGAAGLVNREGEGP